MKVKIEWGQPSTWRGLIMMASGLTVGILTLFGYADQARQVDSVLQTILSIVSGGMVGSGTIGMLSNDNR